MIGLTSSQIASNAFTWGTVAVLPFYTLMVLAPKASFVSTVFAEFVVNNTSNWSVHEHDSISASIIASDAYNLILVFSI